MVATTTFMEKDFGTEIKIFEDFRTFSPTVSDQLSLREITTQNINFYAAM